MTQTAAPIAITTEPETMDATGRLNPSTRQPASPASGTMRGALFSSARNVNALAFATA
jgi:hypothetical protein